MAEINEYPTQDNCDPEDRDQFMSWTLPVFPYFGDTTMPIDESIWTKINHQYWDLGFRWHPELQVKKVLPPQRGPMHISNPTARVVDLDHEQKPMRLIDPDSLTAEENDITLQRYRELGYLEEEIISAHKARVTNDFDPKDHPANTVIGYLMASDDTERSRVLALEMMGKKRDSILRKKEFRGL